MQTNIDDMNFYKRYDATTKLFNKARQIQKILEEYFGKENIDFAQIVFCDGKLYIHSYDASDDEKTIILNYGLKSKEVK